MPVLKNRAKMSTSTTGTGTITLGSAESGFQTFADAGVSNGNVVRYVIEDGNNFEIGTGTYTASGTTLTRTVSESNNSNNAINLSGSATVFISAIDDDIVGGPRGADFDDDVRVRFGAGNDLQIYHDGTTNKSHITESGTSHLVIQGQEIQFDNAAGTSLLNMSASQIEMFHSGSAKLTTESTGINVTGSVKVDNSTEIDDALISIKTSTGTVGAIRFYCESGNAHYTELKSAPHSAYSGNLSFQLPASDGSSGQFLKTDGSGNLSFAAASGGADLYSANESSPSAQPSATGANAVAIGEAPTASGTDSFAVQGGTASGNGALAIGRNVGGGNVSLSRANSTVAIMGSTTSSNHYATAIGLNSSAHLATVAGSGMGAMALGGSYASGGDALAAGIGTNSSSYGASGNGAVTIGYLSKTTSNGYALGKSLVSSGSLSVAIGSDATSSAARSVSLGSSNTASHTDAVVIGSGASSSAADQITLGHTDQTVRISSAYTLPQSDGSNGQVLTTNGSGALSFAAAGGGGGDPDLYRDNASSATTPSATGTNAVAIGSASVASGTDCIAIGTDSSAVQNYGISIGAYSDAAGNNTGMAVGYAADANSTGAMALGKMTVATGDRSSAIGNQAITNGVQATAITDSYASGEDSLAAAIGNNTSSYGAQGSNSISIGYTTKATGSNSVSIGRNNSATHSDSICIGKNILSSATDQISLGNSGTAVRISEAYTLPQADGSNGQVLTTDGSGALSFAAAGGGGGDPALYKDNASSATTPVASGTNALALGNTAVASGENAFAIGSDTDATGLNSLALGKGAQAVSTRCIAMGLNASASADRAVSIGNNGNVATAAYATSIGSGSSGGGSTVAGSGAVALSNARAGGADSFAAVIGNNTATYGATATHSVAFSYHAKASANYAFAQGYEAQALGNSDIALGFQAQANQGVALGYKGKATASRAFGVNNNTNGGATGSSSAAIGDTCVASGTGSVAIGFAGTADALGAVAIGRTPNVNGIRKLAYAVTTLSGNYDGSSQTGIQVLSAATTDATATALAAHGTASTDNQVILPNNSAFAFHGTIVARQQAADGTACAGWKIEGLIRREANAGSTVLVNSATTVLDNTPNWGMVLSADTTNGGLAITCTGASSTDIRWVATVNTSEVTYA